MFVAMPTAMPDDPLTSEIRNRRRKNLRLHEPVVEVRREIDGVLVDVGQHLHRDARESRFGVAVRRGGIAIDAAEVSLAVDERIAQREVLHHSHERVVDRRVAVRVVFAEHVADDGRGFLVWAAGNESELVHRVEHAAVHRLESVAHVGQRARDDDAHRIVDERFFDFFVDEARKDALSVVGSGH